MFALEYVAVELVRCTDRPLADGGQSPPLLPAPRWQTHTYHFSFFPVWEAGGDMVVV